MCCSDLVATTTRPPKWNQAEFTRLAEDAPTGSERVTIKYDGYRMRARIDGGQVKPLTRTGLDWSLQYKRTIEALRSLKVKSAYLDGELCALHADGVRLCSRHQEAVDEGRTESGAQLPLIQRGEQAGDRPRLRRHRSAHRPVR
jgi:bifunctional non-homologous end joining protein LigD